jgi:hypothetical protein
MTVVELYERGARTPLIEVHVPVAGFDHATIKPDGLYRDGLPDVIEYKGKTFVRIADGSTTPRYVRGVTYHAE